MNRQENATARIGRERRAGSSTSTDAPAAHNIAVQQHPAHENVPICNDMTNVEIPVWRQGGCCRRRLCADPEKG